MLKQNLPYVAKTTDAAFLRLYRPKTLVFATLFLESAATIKQNSTVFLTSLKL